jgi:predicted Zn-dependent protease
VLKKIFHALLAMTVGVTGVLTVVVAFSSAAQAQVVFPPPGSNPTPNTGPSMGSNNNGGENLPDIGSPASATISTSDEYRLGAQIVRQLRDEKAIMEDPEVTEYLQALGQRLAAQAPDTNQRFTFFAVNEGTINAFALPGGFIGVNYGTVLASRNESELAGVVGHEVAHVTQRHMARTFHAQSSQGIAQTAAILAAILIGAMTGGSGMEGAIAIAQGAAAQQQVNFTRANEYEADRVGIGFVAGAGFDPNGMASFFEAMSRHEGLAGQYVPEMIQTHPVNSNRIAEARGRAAQYEHPKSNPDSETYECIRERLRVLAMPKDPQIAERYAQDTKNFKGTLGQRYGYALALMQAGKNQDAAKILSDLVGEHENLTLLHSALAQAEVQCALSAQCGAHGALCAGADEGQPPEGSAHAAARSVQQRSADARSDSAHRACGQRSRRHGRRVLLHERVPHRDRRPATRHAAATAGSRRTQPHHRATPALPGAHG